MKIIISIIILASSVQVRGACDYCQPQNSVACHSENVFSLCIDGIATHDYITCPNNYVCTQDYLVCYPKEGAVVSCARDVITSDEGGNLCGVCEPRQKVFSCINETTIAFCFGEDLPVRGSLAQCPANTVCDLDNSKEFCTEKTKATPSCRQLSDGEITTTTALDSTTDESTTTTTGDTTTEQPTMSVTEDSTTEQPTTSTTGDSTTDESTTTTEGDTTTDISITPTIEDSTTDESITTTEGDTTTDISITPTIEDSTTDESITTTEGDTTTDISITPTIEDSTTDESTMTTEGDTTTDISITPTIEDSTTDESTMTTEGDTTTDISITPTIEDSTTDESITTTERDTTTEDPTTQTTADNLTTELSTVSTEVITKTTTVAVPTTSTTSSPSDICKTLGVGTYANSSDPTCKTYFTCINNAGTFLKIPLSCSSGQYFNPTSTYCSPVKPAGCPAASTMSATTETTTTITTTTTTTTKSFDPNAVCQGKAIGGFYKIESDPTCTTYLYCWKANGFLKGASRLCPKGQYFIENGSTGMCGITKPNYCV